MRDFDERDIWDVPRETTGEWIFRVTGARWPFFVALGLTLCIPGCVL